MFFVVIVVLGGIGLAFYYFGFFEFRVCIEVVVRFVGKRDKKGDFFGFYSLNVFIWLFLM